MSHYKFLEKLILAKVCTREHGSPRRRGLSVAAARGDSQSLAGRGKKRNSKSTSKRAAAESVAGSSSTAPKRKSATFVTAAQIGDPTHLFHGMRLDPDVCHLPRPVQKAETGNAPPCALCRWANGKQYKAQVSYCESCEAFLCVWCYKTFHSGTDLEIKKEDICNEILARKAS